MRLLPLSKPRSVRRALFEADGRQGNITLRTSWPRPPRPPGKIFPGLHQAPRASTSCTALWRGPSSQLKNLVHVRHLLDCRCRCSPEMVPPARTHAARISEPPSAPSPPFPGPSRRTSHSGCTGCRRPHGTHFRALVRSYFAPHIVNLGQPPRQLERGDHAILHRVVRGQLARPRRTRICGWPTSVRVSSGGARGRLRPAFRASPPLRGTEAL